MKKYIFILGMLMSGTFGEMKVFAQNQEEPKTLLGNKDSLSLKDFGFFVSPGLVYTQMDGADAALFHLRSGVVIKDQWSLGGFMNVSLNNMVPHSENLQNIYMDFWSVGAFTEYTLFSKKLVHLTFPLYLGYGEVQMDSESDIEPELGEANFFVFEPSAMLELNLHRNVRLNAGAGYRWVSEMSYRNFNQNALSGLNAQVGVKIGLFSWK